MRSILSVLAVQAPLADGWIGTWSPGIGDPTFIGWFTVVAYLAAAHQCWRAYRRLPGSRPGGLEGLLTTLLPMGLSLFVSRRRLLTLPERQRVASLWLGTALVLLLLGINKQLDLQSALTEVGRMMAFDEGWYGARRRVQAGFILAVVVAAAWAFRSLLNLAAGNARPPRSVLVGIVFIFAFVAIRAASFHHIDRLLGLRLGSFNLNWVMEVGGIALVAYGAHRAGPAPTPPVVYAAVPVDPTVGPPRRRGH